MPDSADTRPPETPEGLRPANENPWYILMTLHDEQKGELIDRVLHEKNRRAWNAWSGHALSAEEREAAAKSSEIDMSELEAWDGLAEEIKARFVAEYQRRNPKVDDVPDLPAPEGPIELSKTAFSNTVVLEKAVFASHAQFSSASFARNAWFASVRFTQGAWFDAATFTKSVWFSVATFTQGAWFTSATFTQQAWFISATFKQAARFDAATFTQAARFDAASFSGFAYFTGTRFGSSTEEPCIPDFSDCLFEKPTSFRQALFCDGYPDFSGAVLHDKTSFTARMLPTSDEISEDEDLEGQTYWPQKTKQDPVSARESCATIRHVLTQQGLPEEAHFFFRWEMYFAGLPSEGWSLGARLPYLLFGWLSDFGYSIQRPLWWLVGVWFVGVAVLWAVFSFPGAASVLTQSDLGTAAALSFSNLFPLFGFGRVFLGDVLAALPRGAQVLCGLQTVSSLPLLFFLGLGLRQRFRLR
ncbi:pentapeptide repeat-containing protein [Tritonibacter sp. SIMBA_163]|uniref:pentapeptide repeat-containing protein n=1 Tax=Tritonibacter sp. SIMBA_163 TaxID=3080868 RepID=UPI0039804F4B